jgi:hypothetical protein
MLHNDVEYRVAIPADEGAGSDTAKVSSIIDVANRDSLEFIIATGALADSNATFTVLVEDGDNSALSDAAAVDDAFLLGTEAGASFQFDDDSEVRKIGYIGPKRYVRLTITPANNTGAWDIAVVAALGGCRKVPRSSQSA